MENTKSSQLASRRALSFRFMNAVGTGLRRRGLPIADLSEKTLMRTAIRETGLSDWGNESFRPSLCYLLESLQGTERLTFLPRVWFHRAILQSLVNRLRIQSDLKRHPEISEVPVHRPIFIIGTARTGTTFLHRMLAQDPASRAFRYWELREPSPSPDPQTYDRDPRRRKHLLAASFFERLLFTRSQREALKAVHTSGPDDPEECEFLFMNSFMSFTIAALSAVVTRSLDYVRWLHAQDREWVYREHREQVQLLLWRYSAERLVLKCPAHLWAIDALLEVYPDARLIWTHRDPRKQVASTCNNLALWMSLFLEEPHDFAKLGSPLAEDLDEAIQRALEIRAATDPGRFYDLLYDDLVKDPIDAVRRIYSYFDCEFTEDARQAMTRWLARKRRRKRRVNLYSLEDYGLTTREIDDRFAYYRDEFAIPVEEGRYR
jgi:hypothetical protein